MWPSGTSPARTWTIRQAAALSDVAACPIGVDPATAELDISSVPEESGIYAIYDEDGRARYIGLSKKMRASVEGHIRALGPLAGSLIAAVKCVAMPGQTKDELKAAWEKAIEDQMEAEGEIPAGNLLDSAPGVDLRWRSRAKRQQAPLTFRDAEDPLGAVSSAVQEHPVVLFMKGTPALPQCGFSAKTVNILRELGAQYETVDVLDSVANPGIRDAVKEFSSWPTIPQLYVNGELLGGADIVGELHERGELQPLLQTASSGAPQRAGEAADAADLAATSLYDGDVRLVSSASRPTASAMSRTLDEQLDLRALQIVDESASHEGDAGALEMGLSGESHFTVEIVASDFEGLSAVQRQQQVFATLRDVMPKIHALSLVTRTPSEAWPRKLVTIA